MNKHHLRLAAAAGLGAAAVAMIAACASNGHQPDSPVPLASDIDLPRYMGAWYVIANIPPSPRRMRGTRSKPIACRTTAASTSTSVFASRTAAKAK